MCAAGKRCHVNAKGNATFGSKFPQALVRRLASSSVMIVTRTGAGGGAGARTLLASGTLIAPNVVLCAAHSLQGNSAKDLSFLMFYECDEKTAPAGAFEETVAAASSWRTCKCLALKRQGTCLKILEVGSGDFDYALLAVRWVDAEYRWLGQTGIHVIPPRQVDPDQAEQIEDADLHNETRPADDNSAALELKVPRALTLPAPGSELTGELLLIGHPYSRRAGEGMKCQPTQASVGTLVARDQPDPTASQSGGPRIYALSNFDTYFGASGGGVFNERGEIVGVLKGITGDNKVDAKLASKSAFLHLFPAAAVLNDQSKAGKLAEAASGQRLRQWLAKAPPLLKGDPDANITFRVVRTL